MLTCLREGLTSYYTSINLLKIFPREFIQQATRQRNHRQIHFTALRKHKEKRRKVKLDWELPLFHPGIASFKMEMVESQQNGWIKMLRQISQPDSKVGAIVR